jgi:hypothetical protein
MFAIRTKLSVLLASFLAGVLVLVVWAAPAHTALGPEFSVTFECTESGADVIFVSEDDVDLELFYGPSENHVNENLTLESGATLVVSIPNSKVPGPTFYYEVHEPGAGIGNHVADTLDLSECFDSGDGSGDGDEEEDEDEDDEDDEDEDSPSKAPDAGV